jgi:hypothetical protein
MFGSNTASFWSVLRTIRDVVRWFNAIRTEKSLMKKTSASLAALAGITLIAIASVSPASAGAKRHHADAHWRQGASDIIVKDGLRRRFGGGQRRYFGLERRYFGVDPGRGFGVGPNSYECYGYDCNW